jgi:hypothetical protein
MHQVAFPKFVLKIWLKFGCLLAFVEENQDIIPFIFLEQVEQISVFQNSWLKTISKGNASSSFYSIV